ncbi:MAG: ABC transporter ATP-binding protein [Treponema sp.]|nr:ABC transporter ATP-binding protein [Treponema sp.]
MKVSGAVPPVLETRGVTKRFGRIVANHDISIRLEKGEIIALLGENGAGKSTLMNVLFGLYRPSSGSILIDGEEVSFASPREAIAKGLGMVHQHFMLVPTLTVTQNIILGDEPVILGHVLYRAARRRVVELSERYGLHVDPDARLEDLSVGLQQRVEILKALYREARVLILDEPTAVLTPLEVEELFSVLRRLAEGGTSIIIITHKLEEVMSLSSRVYVLRRGELVGERRTSETDAAELANFMVGRDVVLSVERGEAVAAPEPILRLEAVSVRGARGIPALRGLSLGVGPGEILGIAGVEGNGQAELCDLVVGLARPDSGRIVFHGRDISALSLKRRMEAGIGYVPQDRRGSGLVLPFSVEENLALGSCEGPPLCRRGFLDFRALRENALRLMEDYDIRGAGPEVSVSTLSGGNQQKVILAREFSRKPDFLLVAQPTRGLDVGAIEYVYRRILQLKAGGTAILLISMELEEIFALSDRIAVLHGGELAFEAPTSRTNEIEVGEHMIRGRTDRRAS